MLTRFLHTIPTPVTTCLSKKPEIVALLRKYSIDTDESMFKLKLELNAYVHRHPRRIHREMKTLRTLAERRDLKAFGSKVAVIFHDIYDRHRMEEMDMTTNTMYLRRYMTPTNMEILEFVFDGLFKVNDLEKPTTLPKCFCEKSACITVSFITDILKFMAEGTISDLPMIVNKIKTFHDELPSEVIDCVDKNDEWNELLDVYGINEETDYVELETRMIKYVTFHWLKMKREI